MRQIGVRTFGACAVLGGLLVARPAHAWLFVEHTSIGRAAVERGDDHVHALSRDELAVLQVAWNGMRRAEVPLGVPLCEKVGMPDTPIEREPAAGDTSFDPCIDLPTLAALAADHSCSEEDLVTTVHGSWVKPLIEMFLANYEQIRLTDPMSQQRTSLWHISHLNAQNLDQEYLQRTGTSHFVLARRWMRPPTGGLVPEDGKEYLERVSHTGAPINALGTYVSYHARALHAAASARCSPEQGCARPETARTALLLEAVALHFLEDAYSSGHLAGAPVDQSRAARLGTHDQYCKDGLTVQTWGSSHQPGESYPAFGDAHLQAQDKLWTSRGVRRSLVQLASALSGEPTACGDIQRVDVCSATTLPQTPEACADSMLSVLELMPAPPLESAPVEPFRNDVGAFFRFTMEAQGGLGWTGTAPASSEPPGTTVPTWGLVADAGLGISLEGVTAGWSDAIAAIQGGVSGVAGQRADLCLSCSPTQEPLDARMGWNVRVRMPFDIVPGDFVPFGIAAALGSRWAFTRLVESANGGLYGRWQRIWVLPHGTGLQIVAGREIDYSQYNASRPLASGATPNPSLIYSHSFTFPALDWYWTRTFSQHTGSHLKWRLAYRYEHSDVIDSHFALLSFSSDSDLYFTGF